jgi:hypothetical protein
MAESITNEEKIIGKWKLTKQVEGSFVTDYTSSDNECETTHNYFKDGTMIFHECGETFQYTYTISGNFLYWLKNGEINSDHKIISISKSELILDLLDEGQGDSRIRYYSKVAN